MDLSKYDNSDFDPGAGRVKRLIWYYINALLFDSWILPHSGVKCFLLRLFGAKIGNGVVIKPRVNIKYPWNLLVGDNVWLGEGCWIDNLALITIGSNVCVSQDAYLLTGNHDYKDIKFSLIVKEIHLEDGVWIGAKAIVCPGVRVGMNAVLSVGSVLRNDAEPDSIYQGNFAIRVKGRES